MSVSSASSRFLRRLPILFAGGGVYGAAVYYSYGFFRAKNQDEDEHDAASGCACCTSAAAGALRVQQYNSIADTYDKAIGMDELILGINLLRRILLSWHAQGTVLEVGAGTGRNLPYYTNTKAQRVLMVELSEPMCQQARQKIQKLQESRSTAQQYTVKQGDSQDLHFCPNNAFDTVVDTFGLCSYENPARVLKEMARVCKPDGKILLLEHGRSQTWQWMSDYLDKNAEAHARKWGCIWNRDLDALLEQVGEDLEVQALDKWHFGTTYYVVCKPKQKAARATAAVSSKESSS